MLLVIRTRRTSIPALVAWVGYLDHLDWPGQVISNQDMFVTLYHSGPRLRIHAPLGAYGNHVRWLLMMSQQYQFDIAVDEMHYDSLAGPNWPSYLDYVDQWQADYNIAQEIQALEHRGDLVPTCHLRDDQEKIDFLLHRVYDQSRTWHNWLQHEWTWRRALDTIIEFDHSVPSPVLPNDILLTVDPELAMRCYFKFNSGLNHCSPQQFLADVESFNRHAQAQTQCAVIAVDDLFSPALDIDVYRKLCSAAGITENLCVARQIHQTWYRLHQMAQQDFLAAVNHLYANVDQAKS